MARAGVITADLRRVIENMWGRGKSCAEIARTIGVHRSSVGREVDRNHSHRHGVKNPRRGEAGGRGRYQVGYRADWAQDKTRPRRRRPKPRKLATNLPLRAAVVAGLRDRLSPQQIAAQLREQFAGDAGMRVSHETIYQAIYLQARGSLRELVNDALRTGQRARRSQSRAALAARSAIRGKPWVTEQVHISARPAEVADRAIPGHWEGDLLIGAYKRSAIITLAERSTRFVMLGALPTDRSSPEVIAVIRTLFGRLPAQLHRSLTWDQGVELAGYAQFGLVEDCQVYFCDPHSPWQRGTNENTNGLLRQYFPKGKFDFTTIDQTGLDAVAAQLNRRPRQTLNWHTPAQKLNQHLVALTP
ncbi:IS30 family transposase [Phytohabitans aurantiacus]|uniref:IS30 family transposase n=1 Tax=Phytohabitans aurantiacus TaxID=3016789 RepID=A0ABQ5RED9_9ACTN|nr:IS30 family transposase [Phytohabitans aurantiacus]GLI03966.1 IS30 family transposase [Phytohabitans aurantiacus]